MLMPKRVKYRRPHSLKYDGRAKAGREISFGEYGLQALEGDYISAQQIEAARIALSRYTKRSGQIWIRIFPHMARTKKPLEVRMGSGKGNPESWVAVVQAGRVLFEVAGIPEADALEALRLAANKLSIRTKIIRKEKSGE